MSNTLLTTSMITNEALMILENNLKCAGEFSRQYDSEFGKTGAKIGDTLGIRLPARLEGGEGQSLNIENFEERQVNLVLEKQFHVGLQFTSKELALSVDMFNKRVLAPKVATLANKIDDYCTGIYTDVHNFVGTPGTTPNTLLTYLQAGQKMDEEACPQDDQRTMLINPAARVSIVDALKGLFQASADIARQYRTGQMGTAIGFNWVMDQNVQVHTVGALGGTPLVNGASQTGSSLITDGWTSAAATRLLKGDVVTAASSNAVNPQNRRTTGSLRQFVVTADTASDSSGNLTIPVYPAITPSGQYQTVDASPGDGDAILIFGHASSFADTQTPVNMAFHKEAFALGVADLPLYGGLDKSARASDDQLGISLRMQADYEIKSDLYICRLDVLVGRVAKYPQLATRVQG